MPLKLIYTSAPRLLQAGRSGFGTVAMSRDIPFQAVKLAEECSKFSRQSGLSAERVVYSYRTVRCSDCFWHILSCLRDAGTDYSGRTNHLAQHLMFDSREASACALEGKTPAGVILGTAWPDHDGFCGWLEESVYWDAHEPEPTWEWWRHYAGSGDCRRNLSSDAALRGATLVYGGELEEQTDENARKVLCLFAESQADCPEHGWGVTFTTSVEPNDELSEFRWIGVAANSPMLPKVEAAGGRVRVSFDTPPPPSRQHESTRTHLEVKAPDALRAAAPQQQNFRTSDDDAGSKVQGSVSNPPPLGRRTPPPPVSRVPEHAARRWLKNFWKPLAFSAGLLLVVSAAYIVFFPAPPRIEFIKTTFPAYTGKPVQLEVRTIPSGREHEVKIEPLFLNKAGKTKVTASIEGKWLGEGTNVTSDITIPHKPANIEFELPSLKQVWPPGKQVSITVKPKKDEGNGEPLTNKVEISYKAESQDESAWTTKVPRPNGTQTNFDVRARFSDDSNYVGEKRAKLIITTQEDKKVADSPGLLTASTSDNLPAEPNAAVENRETSTQTSPTPLASSVRFLLADKSQVLSLLPGKMPTNGVLSVVERDDSSKSVNIDRKTGIWFKGDKIGGLDEQLFDMDGPIPNDKTPKKNAPVNVGGPLVYEVKDGMSISFVAIELVPGDNSTLMQRFFQRVNLEKQQDSVRIQFSLKDAVGSLNLDQFETGGGRFDLEITEHPYNAKDPLKLNFGPDGELVVVQERDKLTGALAKKVAEKEKAAKAAAQSPWDRTKGELLKPLEASLNQKPDPRVVSLFKAIESIAQPKDSTVQTNATMLVGTLLAETFRVLETDKLTSSAVQLSKDRNEKKNKEKSKKSGAATESLSQITDVSLLSHQEWKESLDKDAKKDSSWKPKALDWITGRKDDVKAKKGDNEDKDLVQSILERLHDGINTLELPDMKTWAKAQTDQNNFSRQENLIQEKLKFLKELSASSSPVAKQGRLLLVTPSTDSGGLATTNTLWSNVILFGGSEQGGN